LQKNGIKKNETSIRSWIAMYDLKDNHSSAFSLLYIATKKPRQNREKTCVYKQKREQQQKGKSKKIHCTTLLFQKSEISHSSKRHLETGLAQKQLFK